MIAYVDSSVILRKLFGQPRALGEWRLIRRAVASALIEVECLRTIDRLRLAGGLSEDETARRRAAVYEMMESVELVYPTGVVLDRAAQPMSTAIGSLDAVHLATALVWQERNGKRLIMATHDDRLGAAARATGMKVVGTTLAAR
jgi:predicted nucleic acid-binding protein